MICKLSLLSAFACLLVETVALPAGLPAGMAQIPAGGYVPFFAKLDSNPSASPRVRVPAFNLDVYPVTNEDFLRFVRANPDWRRSRVRQIFADSRYLANWSDDLRLESSREARSPVTQVSWFAAEAYCEWKGKTLPTVDQWEYAARGPTGETPAQKQRILSWYDKPTPRVLPPVGSTFRNGFGLYDMHGLIWEWTLDFDTAQVNPQTDSRFSCGGGSLGAVDPSDYAAFMRYAFRSSLRPDYTVANLGFRCSSPGRIP